MLRSRTLLLSLACLLTLAGPAVAETPGAALERAAEAYRALPRLAEQLDYTVRFPDGREEAKKIEYGRADGRIFLAMLAPDGTRAFHLTAAEGALRAVQFNAGGAFLDAPLGGSFAEALAGAGGFEIGIPVPPGLAAFEPGEQVFAESLGLGVLRRLRPEKAETADGVTSVTLRAEAGTAVARLDAATGRLTALSLVVGDGDSSVRLDGSFLPISAPPRDPRWAVDTAGRRPVATFTELEASSFPLGRAAPDLSVRSLAGDEVSLASLRGRVVILDFWATWCVPCWRALEEVEKVARWAEESGRPISVWAVDTLERTTTFAEQAATASGFLASRGLDLPVLVDVDDSFFAGMYSPGLPSTVVIAPDGTLARYHSGVPRDLAASLRAEATVLLNGSSD